MRFERIRPEDLSEADVETWRQIASGQADTGSPFLGPDWARLVAQCQGPDADRARILVIRDGAEPVGFLGARVGPFTAKAVGAPFCDYQGLVLRPGIGLHSGQLVDGLGIARLDLQNTLMSDPVLSSALRPAPPAMLIDLAGGFEAYARERKVSGSDAVTDSAKKMRKLSREHDGVTFKAGSADPDDLATLIGWKRAQYLKSGQTDVLAPDWSRQMLARLFASTDPHLKAILFTLHADGQVIAAHLALASAGRLHAWIIAHDDAYRRYSPGQILLHELTRWAADHGFVEIDLGPGDSQFKVRSANARRSVGNGYVGRPSPSTWWRAAAFGVRDVAESLPLGSWSALPGKAMRRVDVIRSLRG